MSPDLQTIHQVIIAVHQHILNRFDFVSDPTLIKKFAQCLEAWPHPQDPADQIIGTIYSKIKDIKEHKLRKTPILSAHYHLTYLHLSRPIQEGFREEIITYYSDPHFFQKIEDFISYVLDVIDSYGNQKAPPIARYRND